MKVLALDPGERVGWAALTIYTHFGPVKAKDAPCLHVDDYGMSYLKDMALALEDALAAGRYDRVVMEGFKLTPKGAKTSIGSTMQTCQFIGMVRDKCWRHDVPLTTQWPADMSSARRSMKNDIPGAEQVREIVASADAVSHDNGHFGSATLHGWHWFFTEFV